MNLSIADVISSYGMTLYASQDSQEPIDSVEPLLKLWKLEVPVNSKSTGEYSGYATEETKLNTFAADVLFKRVCRITDFKLWIERFGVDPEMLPFSENLLTQFRLVVFRPPNVEIGLVLPFSSIDEAAFDLNRTADDLRMMLDPSYKLKKIFHPIQSAEQIDENFRLNISRFDLQLSRNLATREKMEKFKQEMMNAALHWMKEKPDQY